MQRLYDQTTSVYHATSRAVTPANAPLSPPSPRILVQTQHLPPLRTSEELTPIKSRFIHPIRRRKLSTLRRRLRRHTPTRNLIGAHSRQWLPLRTSSNPSTKPSTRTPSR